MATSSERSPPPFPDLEEQDVLDSEDVGALDSDEGEEFFASTSNDPLTEMDTTLPSASQSSDVLTKPPSDIMSDPLIEPVTSQTESKPISEVVSEPSDDFVDLTNSEANAAEGATAETGKDTTEIPLDEPSDDFVEILGSETEAPREEVVVDDVTVEAAPEGSGVTSGITNPPSEDRTGRDLEQEVKEAASAPLIDISSDSSAHITQDLPVSGKAVLDPLDDLLSEAPPPDVKAPSRPPIDLFEDEENDLFTEPRQTTSAKQPQKSLFGEPDEDLFGEPLGAISKKTEQASKEQRDKTVPAKGGSDGSTVVGPLHGIKHGDPADIFTEEAVTKTPSVPNTSTVNSKTNGIHSEEEADIFAEATVELSLDSPRNERKKNVTATPSAPAAASGIASASATTTTAVAASSSSAASLTKPQPAAALEELEEEEEQEDKFDIFVSVTDPEKIGDGMNAYMAYKVTTQTTLPMFRRKSLTVMRRFSDFLGIFQKLTEKHGPNGCIVPPPPEKSILGMTKVKVGKEDPSSGDFVERRRGALERYLQRIVAHPSLLQDPDVREFLERDELPRAVSTQALSGAGFLKMINKATDAVSKMTIKMNESDVWFEEKLQEVESADQQFRKLLTLVESLVGHRKELSLNTASFAKSVAMLGSAEDNTALSRALSQLAEVEDKMEQLHQDQAANDTFNFSELIADYIRLLGAVRGSFDQRMKAWQRWQDAQTVLQKKRETEAKLLWANKPDKLQQAKDDISEWEAKVTQYERDFDRVSATVRKEVLRFEKEKARNFKRQIMKYLESMLQSQQQLIKYWEAFLPEAKAIA